MEHNSTKVTFLYGHLMSGTTVEGAALLDGFLNGQVVAAEGAPRAGVAA